MESKIRGLTILNLITLLVGAGVWYARFGLYWPALAVAALSLVLLVILAVVQSRYVRDLKQRQKEELETQRNRQSEALSQAAARNRAEMDAFRSGLAHTLRMPVAIIQGYADLLTSGVVTEDTVRDEYLRKISDRSQYMTEAISRQFASNETLDSSKLHYSDLDLLTLIRQAAADMQTAAANHGVTIQVVASESHIPIRADGYLINRVLFNLLENALKYMGRPGVITVWAQREGERVTLRVQDDGLGLPTEEVPHIFEPKFQGSNHTQGQGYGLYLVKQAIEGHGGTITAQSSPGRGLGLIMELPAVPVEAA